MVNSLKTDDPMGLLCIFHQPLDYKQYDFEDTDYYTTNHLSFIRKVLLKIYLFLVYTFYVQRKNVVDIKTILSENRKNLTPCKLLSVNLNIS